MSNKCQHKDRTMFIKCSDHEVIDHLHCMTCGKLITMEYIMTKMDYDELCKSSKIYESRSTCQKITNHL